MRNVPLISVAAGLCMAAGAALTVSDVAIAETIKAETGISADLVLLPKFLGILPFDQARQGAEEAHAELKNPGKFLDIGPTPDNSVAGQIEIMTTAATKTNTANPVNGNRSRLAVAGRCLVATRDGIKAWATNMVRAKVKTRGT